MLYEADQLFCCFPLVGPPAPQQYTNYEEQHFTEIMTLFTQLNGIDTPILMGDFNHGPASPRENIIYEFPFQYGLMIARGFVSPYVLHDGRCTFCSDNPAVAITNYQFNLIVDHVYLLADMYKGRVISSKVCVDQLIVHAIGNRSVLFYSWRV